MTVKKIGMVGIAAALLLVILISPIAGAQSNEDDELDEMNNYLQDNKSDLKITPTLEDGQELFNQFSFADESYDVISLLNFLFYFMASGGTIWVGIIALKDILKGTTDVKSIYNDVKGRKSVQGIILIVLAVRIVYVVIDFIFNYDM